MRHLAGRNRWRKIHAIGHIFLPLRRSPVPRRAHDFLRHRRLTARLAGYTGSLNLESIMKLPQKRRVLRSSLTKYTVAPLHSAHSSNLDLSHVQRVFHISAAHCDCRRRSQRPCSPRHPLETWYSCNSVRTRHGQQWSGTPWGMLDLDWDSGQRALRENGLEDEFKRLSRRDAEELRLCGKAGIPLVHHKGSDPTEEDLKNARPEIDCHVLRQLFLDSVPADSIKWGHGLVELTDLCTGHT
ncbi:hypothetical protein BD414DRAFT_329912 [Trametes punicea]|nr:hypothetical protein BD414DRAFT_329912 [Trametes punicea]